MRKLLTMGLVVFVIDTGAFAQAPSKKQAQLPIKLTAEELSTEYAKCLAIPSDATAKERLYKASLIRSKSYSLVAPVEDKYRHKIVEVSGEVKDVDIHGLLRYPPTENSFLLHFKVTGIPVTATLFFKNKDQKKNKEVFEFASNLRNGDAVKVVGPFAGYNWTTGIVGLGRSTGVKIKGRDNGDK